MHGDFLTKNTGLYHMSLDAVIVSKYCVMCQTEIYILVILPQDLTLRPVNSCTKLSIETIARFIF